MEPLASRLRPEKIEDVIGQKHILGKGKMLASLIEKNKLMNMIFYGPPGTGKTTVARLLANKTNQQFIMLNASTDSLKDVKDAIDNLNTLMGYDGIVLYIDEIHMFNKRNQQILLDYIEDGRIVLVGSTTENPHFAVFKALISRCLVVEFKSLSIVEVIEGIDKGLLKLKEENNIDEIKVDNEVKNYLAHLSSGDMRMALSRLEALFVSKFNAGSKRVEITKEDAENLLNIKMINYDADGDRHYDILSAFHKSVRGSNPDAALTYLALMIKGGDLISICRRLLAIASEDIGLAHPQAIPIVKASVDSAMQLGFPEANLPLSFATIFLATAPKSNSAATAIGKAMSAIENYDIGDIPEDLRDAHYSGAKKLGRGLNYQYPHDFKNHYVEQEYMPKGLKNMKFYEFSDNKLEELSRAYWENIKGNSNK